MRTPKPGLQSQNRNAHNKKSYTQCYFSIRSSYIGSLLSTWPCITDIRAHYNDATLYLTLKTHNMQEYVTKAQDATTAHV